MDPKYRITHNYTNSSHNNSHLINCRCEWTLSTVQPIIKQIVHTIVHV